MRKLVLRSMVFTVLVAVLAVCGVDNTSAPAPQPIAPQTSLLGGDLLGGTGGTVDNLLAPLSCNTKGYGSVTMVMGNPGGSISVGPHTLTIPSGALGKSVSITMSAPKGNIIQVKFLPEGLAFNKPTSLTLSYGECGLLVLNPKVVFIDDDRNILETLLSLPNLLGKTVTGQVGHFSAYAVAE